MADKKRFSNLFWKISAVFFVMLTIIGMVYLYLMINYSGIFFDEVNQKLNRNAAADIVKHSTPFIDGKVNEQGVKETFNSVMSISPAMEVYLLDNNGKILSFYAPEHKIMLTTVDMSPLRRFIQTGGTAYITGEDPRHKGQQKIFSAAPVISDGKQSGYIYVILSGDQYEAASGALKASYVFRLGIYVMLVTLLSTLLLGLLFIRVITRNFSRILVVMQRFRKGDLKARIALPAGGDVRELGNMFNEMADMLTDNIEQVQQVEVLRRELIANVSHDLRTPVSIIHGYAETLQMKIDTLSQTEVREYLDTVMESATDLEVLISELFELSKLEANQVQPAMEAFDISELVSDMSNKYKLSGAARNIDINTLLSHELPAVYADISLVERVLQNLTDNALKFTSGGGCIEICTRQTDGYVTVSVADNGFGIADHEQERIFDRHYKAGQQGSARSGAGLGLAIVKKILELHGTQLYLVSELGKGSTFTFRLPFYNEKNRN